MLQKKKVCESSSRTSRRTSLDKKWLQMTHSSSHLSALQFQQQTRWTRSSKIWERWPSRSRKWIHQSGRFRIRSRKWPKLLRREIRHSDTHFDLTFPRTPLSAQNQVALLAGQLTNPNHGRPGRPASALIVGRAALRTSAMNLEMNCLWRRLKANLIRFQGSILGQSQNLSTISSRALTASFSLGLGDIWSATGNSDSKW